MFYLLVKKIDAIYGRKSSAEFPFLSALRTPHFLICFLYLMSLPASYHADREVELSGVVWIPQPYLEHGATPLSPPSLVQSRDSNTNHIPAPTSKRYGGPCAYQQSTRSLGKRPYVRRYRRSTSGLLSRRCGWTPAPTSDPNVPLQEAPTFASDPNSQHCVHA
jgi:hypothetical protein